MEKVVDELRARLGSSFKGAWKVREDRFVVLIDASSIREAVAWLFNERGARLSTISVVDSGLDFEVVYHMAMGRGYLNLKAKVPKERPVVDSITPIVPGAALIEREVQDLFGVVFQGHPDPRRVALPFEAPGDLRPLKKPLRGLVTEAQKPGVESFIATGLRYPITFAVKRQRVKLGLPETIRCTATDQASLEEFQKLVRAQGVDEQVGFDWSRRRLRY
ncbi:MAG: NADH-quinone oxidoreductase subunit C [Candidatus Nezhaarchaeota archaeon]|nr:NADH-quinone oxidoreductase subunit C [Candidatus Nezhaarchaeota archaeon]